MVDSGPEPAVVDSGPEPALAHSRPEPALAHSVRDGGVVPVARQRWIWVLSLAAAAGLLALYQLGIAQRYRAELPIELVWHYVARGTERRSVRSPEQLEAMRVRTIGSIDAIRRETEFAPRKSPLCGWCEFRPLCPAWNPQAPEPPARRRAAPHRASSPDGPRQLPLL